MDMVTGVGVLDKAMVVIRAVVEQPLGLAELQRTTGLPRATAHRLAVALEQHGLLRRDGAGRFDLGAEFVAIGRVALERFPLVDLSRDALQALRDDTGESVQLFVVEGHRRRCVLSLQSAHALRWIVPEGAALPLEVGSAGRVLSGETCTNGWIESVEEREPGVASVSAPVVDRHGLVVAAVSLSGPVERLTRAPGAIFGQRVAAAADAINVAAESGGDGSGTHGVRS